MAYFVVAAYEADNGEIHPIRISPETLAAQPTQPTGTPTITNRLRVKVSRSGKEYGVKPRGLNLARRLGTSPNFFNKYKFLPILLPQDYEGVVDDATITVNGVVWAITSGEGENAR
jgi:hypothetical protein